MKFFVKEENYCQWAPGRQEGESKNQNNFSNISKFFFVSWREEESADGFPSLLSNVVYTWNKKMKNKNE